jgi:putative peptidoglycan lipid II flippase
VESAGDSRLELTSVERASFPRSASLIGGVSLLTTALNFLTSVLIAKYFGAGRVTDALFVALTLGNAIAPPLISSLDAAFLPVFYRLAGPERIRLGREATAWFGLIFVLLGALIWATRSAWVRLFLHDPASYQPDLDRLILVGAIAFAALGTAMTVQKTLLTGELRFQWIGLTNLMPPAGILLFVIAFHDRLGVMSVMVGMAVGAGVALVVAQLASRGPHPLGPKVWYGRELIRMTLENLPLATSALLFALNSVILRATASLSGVGGISAQYYAERIFFLPHTLIAVSAASVILPFLMRWRKSQLETIGRIVVYGCLLMGPVALTLLIFAPEIVAVALQHGRFSASAAQLTSAAIRGYSLGLAPLFIATLTWRVLQARHDLAQVVVVGAIFFLTTLATAVPLFDVWGLFGIGAANTAGSIAAMIAALAFLFAGQSDSPRPRFAVRSLATIGIGLLAMAAVALLGSRLLTAAPAIARLGFAIIVPPAVYVGTLFALRLAELRELRLLGRAR